MSYFFRGPIAGLAATCAVAIALATGAAKVQADERFGRCLAGLRDDAIAKGVSAQTFTRITKNLEPDLSVLERLDYQPEFKTPIWDYLAALVDDERIAEGRAMLARWHDTLLAIEREYGVDPATVVAVWGVESNFGKSFGTRPLLTSLGTLSCYGRRQGFFRGEFFTTMRIVQDGHVAQERLLGSWAGAFGHTQFMPSTFMRIAVDFDGDGKRDIVDSIPDALASTANYLKRSGWRTGQTWGYEVALPKGFDESRAGRKSKRPLSQWTNLGLRAYQDDRRSDSPQTAASTMAGPNSDAGANRPGVSGSARLAADARAQQMGSEERAGLILPAGPTGPAFLVFRNFDAIYSYNAAESYALAIAHLADRLRGGGEFIAAWPTDDIGLSRVGRRELQTLLILRGHDIGEVDGMIGSRTREAIKAEEQRLGMPPSGRAGSRILRALRDQKP
jgi:lytic murein transglycosylase